MNYQQSIAKAYFGDHDPFVHIALSKLKQPLSEEWGEETALPINGPVEGPHKTVSELLFQMMDHRNSLIGKNNFLHHHLTAEPESLVDSHNEAVKQGASMHHLATIKDTFDRMHSIKPAVSKRLANGTFVNAIY